MLIEFILKNFGTFVELVVMLGGGLVLVGMVKKELQTMREKLIKHEGKLEETQIKYNEHLLEAMPHKSCLVEVSKQADLTLGLAELRRAVSRVEGWVMQMANKQGIKGPFNNGD